MLRIKLVNDASNNSKMCRCFVCVCACAKIYTRYQIISLEKQFLYTCNILSTHQWYKSSGIQTLKPHQKFNTLNGTIIFSHRQNVALPKKKMNKYKYMKEWRGTKNDSTFQYTRIRWWWWWLLLHAINRQHMPTKWELSNNSRIIYRHWNMNASLHLNAFRMEFSILLFI